MSLYGNNDALLQQVGSVVNPGNSGTGRYERWRFGIRRIL